MRYELNRSGGHLLAVEARVSIPGQPLWDIWWTQWHWDRFTSESVGFPLHHYGDALNSSTSTPFSYQKNKWAKPGNLPSFGNQRALNRNEFSDTPDFSLPPRCKWVSSLFWYVTQRWLVSGLPAFRDILKQSHYRPEQAQKVPGGLRFPDFKTIGTWRSQGCQPYAPAAFTPRKYSRYSFLLEAESTPGPYCSQKDYVNEKC